jgi:hypothetical protein
MGFGGGIQEFLCHSGGAVLVHGYGGPKMADAELVGGSSGVGRVILGQG